MARHELISVNIFCNLPSKRFGASFFFAPKPNENACYAGYIFGRMSISCFSKKSDRVSPVTEKLCRTWSGMISSLKPFVPKPRTKYPFRISSLTLILLSQQVLFLCKRRVNFLYFEMLPSLPR